MGPWASSETLPPACDHTGCVIFEVSVQVKSSAQRPSSYLQRETLPITENQSTMVETQYRLHNDTCSKSVKVPYPIYQSITSILGQLAGENGQEVPPILTPAQQAIMVFYATLMQQTLNFQCAPQEFLSNNGTESSPDNPVESVDPHSWQFQGFIKSGNEPEVILKQSHQLFYFRPDDEITNGWFVKSIDVHQRFIILDNQGRRKKVFIGEQFKI